MKRIFYFLLFIALTFIQGNLPAQNSTNNQMPGAPAGAIFNQGTTLPNGIFSTGKISSTSPYSTTTFTFEDITIFSYFDSTVVTITNSSSTQVGTATLKADTLYSISPGQGIYTIDGNKPYSVLIGDAITNYVNGYFALDQGGRGTSTKLNTWMMNEGGYDPHFIIFAYNDSTGYTIKELATGNFIYAGTLNNGQYLNFPNIASINRTALQVVSNKPVSALSYTDQDYYVPSANGTFAGTLFYGFSGIAGGWTNSITISSYDTNNVITVKNLAADTVIKSFTLGRWQVRTIPITKDTYWKVQSSKTVTAANIPFAGWTGSYYYMARAADSTGKNFGTSFIVPTIASTISIFSYEDNNIVHIVLLGDTTYPYTSTTSVADTLLQKGKGYIFTTPYGNKVYRIYSDKNVSVLQSNGGYGADFMPLGYTLNLPDLAVTGSDITFNPTDDVFKDGDQIKINVTVRNEGTIDASNINVMVYDGDPDAGSAPPIGSYTIPNITAGGSYTFSIPAIVPQYSQYHFVYVKVDPGNLISEGNESNNKASRPFRPNADLQPPLAVTISAPSAINPPSSPSPNSVNKVEGQQSLLSVTSNIFNIGSSTQTNVKVKFNPQNGLTVVSGPTDTTISSVPVASSVQITWTLSSNKDSSGYNLYSLNVGSDSAAAKNVSRTVIVLDTTAPAKPKGLIASLNSGKVVLNWTKNTETDLGGYKIYYGSDGVNWNGTGATEGNSPITVSTINQFNVSGLASTKFYFALKAFDVSNNASGFSDTVSANLTGITDNSSTIPTQYSLYQNYPNPFNPSTIIRYALPFESKVKIMVYDILGREVKELLNTVKAAGIHEVEFNAKNLTSGIYLYRINAVSSDGNKGFSNVKKLILLK